MAIEVRHLRYFVTLAEELNFTRAARRLGITQQSLSHGIGQFETELGTRLVDRDSRSARLTPTGAAVLQDARQVLDDLDVLLRRARGLADQLGGTLRVGCSYDLQPLLTPLLGSLRSRQPDLTAQVTIGAQRGLLDDLRAHRLDAVVTWRRPVEDADLRMHPLLSARLLPVVRETDPLALVPPPVPRHRLHHHVLIIHPRRVAPGPYDQMIEQLALDGPVPHDRLQLVEPVLSGHQARLDALRADRDPAVLAVTLMADFAYRALDQHGTVALDVEPPMTIDIHLLRMPNAPDGTRRASSYLADLARTASSTSSTPPTRRSAS